MGALSIQKDFVLFGIVVEATKKGMSNSNAVIEAIFSHINHLHAHGITEETYSSFQRISLLNFIYERRASTMEDVSELSSSLTTPRNILIGGRIFANFDPEMIEMNLEEVMRGEESLVLLGDPGYTVAEV